MPKDFANKTRSPRQMRKKSRNSDSTKNNIHIKLRWYAGGITSGMILSLIIYLWFLPPKINQEESKFSVLPDPKLSTKKKTSTNKEETLFEFYDILPTQSLEADEAIKGSGQNVETSRNYVYFLQAGAFRQKKDAESRRAELMLLDLDPVITAASIDDGQLYRISVGPIESIQETKKIQSLIENEGIKTVIKKRVLP